MHLPPSKPGCSLKFNIFCVRRGRLCSLLEGGNEGRGKIQLEKHTVFPRLPTRLRPPSIHCQAHRIAEYITRTSPYDFSGGNSAWTRTEDELYVKT